MKFSCRDTPFYYRIDGELKQALEITIPNETKAKPGTVTVDAQEYGKVETKIPKIKRGTQKYTAYAPVVYPNFKNLGFAGMSIGRHRPVQATVELRVESDIETKKLTIGSFRPWTVYVCQDVCSDYTWGYTEDKTESLSVTLTNAHLEAIDRTEKEPFESQQRWNINQTMEAMWFLQREREDVKKLFERETDGHISISPTFNSNLTATMTTEQAIRSLYYGRELERYFGIDISIVDHIEMPTITWGMATIFAGAGVRNLVKGWLLFMEPFLTQRDDIPLFYWEGPDGSRVLAASDKGACLRASYAQAGFLRKDYEDFVKELHDWWIPHFENHTEYPYDAFVLLGSHGDLHTWSPEQIVPLVSNIIRYNSEPWEYPKIVNANWRHFFEHIESFVSKYGIAIPVLRGDFGVSWEEWPAHLAGVFSEIRKGVNVFITAETLLALASLFEPKVYSDCRDKLKTAETYMEHIAEHPWNGTTQEEKVRAFKRKSRWKDELNRISDEVSDIAFDVICKQVSTKPETNVLVFNSLSWERTDIVNVETPASGFFVVRDNETGENLPNDIVDVGRRRVITFIARKVPPLGYKTHTISRGNKPEIQKRTVTVKGKSIENNFYFVRVDGKTGGIQRLFDKRRGVELVDTKSSYKLNQYTYLSEGKEHSPVETRISKRDLGQVSGSLIVESSTLRSKIRTTITLYSELDRIDITNEVEKTPSSEPQEIHFVFPFNVPDCVYHYEATGTIIKPGLTQYGGEQLRGSGQTSHSCQTFIDVSNDSYGVMLSQVESYLVQFGHRTTFEVPTHPDPSNSTVWSLLMMNKCHELLPDQGGISSFVFRYSLRGHDGGFKGFKAVHFGWERNKDLLVKVLKPNQKGSLPNRSYSFLSCQNANAVVTALKVSEEGLEEGLILRSWETDGKATDARFDVSNLKATSSIRTDLLERDQEKLEISKGILEVAILARGLATVRLSLGD